MNRFQRFALLLCATAFTTLTTSVCAEEITLRGVSAFPKGMALTDDFQRYIDMVNQTGKGVVQIRLVGGPEVTPAAEQGAALGKGVFDVLFGPPTYYAGIFPEADAFAGELLWPNGSMASCLPLLVAMSRSCSSPAKCPGCGPMGRRI